MARYRLWLPGGRLRPELLVLPDRVRRPARRAGSAAQPCLVLAGDSSMSDYPERPRQGPLLAGWGQGLRRLLRDGVVVLNHAASGRSARSFLEEGLWGEALAHVEPGALVLVQFGHNDQKPGRRASDPGTTYRDHLRRYVDEARAAGGTAVLITPVARRTFDAAGRPVSNLWPYAEAVLAVAAERGAPAVDLHAGALALFARLGDEGSAHLSVAPGDRTHFSPEGALQVARLVVEALVRLHPAAAAWLREPAGR